MTVTHLVVLLIGAVISPSHGSYCVNGGTLELGPSGEQFCACHAGYAGKDCQYEPTAWCSLLAASHSEAFCTNTGVCRETTLDGSHPGCNCVDGRVGDHCEFEDDEEYLQVRAAMGIVAGDVSALNDSSHPSNEGLSAGSVGGIVIAVMLIAAILAMSAILIHRLNQNHTVSNGIATPDYALDPDGTSTFSDGPRIKVMRHTTILMKIKGMISGRREKPITDVEVVKDWDLPDKTLEAMEYNDGVLSPIETSRKHAARHNDFNLHTEEDIMPRDNGEYLTDGEDEISFASENEMDSRESVSSGVITPPSSSFNEPSWQEIQSPPVSQKSIIDKDGFPLADGDSDDDDDDISSAHLV